MTACGCCTVPYKPAQELSRDCHPILADEVYSDCMPTLKDREAIQMAQKVLKQLHCSDESYDARQQLRQKLANLPPQQENKRFDQTIDALKLPTDLSNTLKWGYQFPNSEEAPKNLPSLDIRIRGYGKYIEDLCISR